MALTFACLLVLIYAVAAPFGRRVRAAEAVLLEHLVGWSPTGGEVARVRALFVRGWASFATSDLWPLLLMAALIAIFEVWWLSLVLPVVGVALDLLLHRVDPFPKALGWYLGVFLEQIRKEGERADIAAEVEELLKQMGSQPVPVR